MTDAPPVGLLVRAVVDESGDVDAFDEWYGTHHMPIGAALLQAPATRGWSLEQPHVHYALYGFPSIERMQQRIDSLEFRAFATDFDQTCPTQATRARETLRFAQSVPAAAFAGELPPPGAGVLLCRSELSRPGDRESFDDWQATHHLALAANRLGARAARFWSAEDPDLHYSLYQLDSVERMEERLGSADYAAVIEDLDRTCPLEVARSTERLRTAQSLPRPS